MSQNKNTILISKLRLIIAATLLFVFYSSFSQNNKTRVNAFTLDIKGGVNLPANDFKNYADNGFHAGVTLNKAVYKNLGLGVSANYNHFGLKDNFESTDNAWSSVSLAVGPQYTLPLSMFFIQVYGHIGMSLIKSPGITKDADNIPDYFDKYDEGFFNTFKMESESNTGFHTDIGIKVGAQLSKRLIIFVGSTYTTSLNSPIKYDSRDISKAFHPSGEIDIEMIRTTPFEEKSLAFTSLNVNAGITINLGKTSNTRSAQDYNSSRSNKPSPIAFTNDTIGNDTMPKFVKDYNASRKDYDAKKPKEPRSITPPDSVTGNDSVPRPVQDYNSSRSNKPRPIRDTAEKDTVQRPVQDYNSSRSNKPRPIAWSDAVTVNDSVPRPAQDYNSSRSNKPSPIVRTDDEIDNDSVPRAVQDYNSSRSNKPRPITWINDTIGNDTVPKIVKDYNASRRDYDAKKPKEPRSVTPPDSGTENDSVPRPAQDYNSSRSNKPSPMREIDDSNSNDTVPKHVKDYNASRKDYDAKRPKEPRSVTPPDSGTENDSVPKPVQDYNSSRSNKPRPIIDTAEKDTVQGPLHAQDYNSSRSNKPSPIAWSDIETGNDSVPRPVQDYNSSRSNKPRSVREIDDIIVNDSLPIPVQDYNSSRSNKPKPIRRIDDINDIDNDEDGVVVIGKLTAIDLKARSFELMDKKGRKMSGKFQPRVTNEEIKKLRDEFLNKEANIHVKINKTKLETGKVVISYEL